MVQWELGAVKECCAKKSRGLPLQIIKITSGRNSVEENLKMKEHDQHLVIIAQCSFTYCNLLRSR